jgi:hypothetical protein
MIFFFKRVAILAATTACVLTVGVSATAADVGLQNVQLSCSDETNLGLTLSAAEVTSLTNAVTAMSLYPAGLTCGVSTQLDPPPGGNPRTDYAVGGGDQFFTQPRLEAPCTLNYSFSVHTPSNDPGNARGSFNETIPGGCAGFGFTAELRVTITCLHVTLNHADMRGTVTRSTGAFTNDGFVRGSTAYITADDNGGAPLDQLGVHTTPSGTSPYCQGTSNQAATTHGNINVHDAAL